MSKFLRGLGIVGMLLGFIFSFRVVYWLWSQASLAAGFLFFPLVFLLLPFYTGFVLGNWTLFLLNYGSIAAYWLLGKIADNMEK